MKEHPILFSAPMVRAILAGSKSQTRRVVGGCRVSGTYLAGPDTSAIAFDADDAEWYCDGGHWQKRCPYGQPGDRLWVREAWGRDEADIGGDRHWMRFVYRADPGAKPLDNGTPVPWRPSIHMPRAASRLTLDVTGVRVERLQEISQADAKAEGIVETHGGFGLPDGSHFHGADPRESYWSLWEAINGPGCVEANPWVWVVEFKRIEALR